MEISERVRESGLEVARAMCLGGGAEVEFYWNCQDGRWCMVVIPKQWESGFLFCLGSGSMWSLIGSKVAVASVEKIG